MDAAREAGDVGVLARAQLGYNSLRVRVDPEATVEDELAEALRIASELEGSDELAALATAHAEVGTCKFQLGRAGEGERDLERAFRVAVRAGDQALMRDAMAARLRPAGFGPMPAAEAVALCRELLAADYRNASLEAAALEILALSQAMLGDTEASRRAADEAWRILEEFDLALSKGLYACDVGLAEMLGGDLDRAEYVLRRGHDHLVGIGDTGVRSTVDGILGNVLFLLGRDDEALELAEESRSIASRDDLDSQPRWRVVRARVLGKTGQFDEALALLDEAVAIVEPLDFLEVKGFVHDVLAELLLQVGRAEEARAAVERAIGFHELKGNVVSAGRSRTALAELRASQPS
jgi:tetratricopeptide (TPR) repeat protein